MYTIEITTEDLLAIVRSAPKETAERILRKAMKASARPEISPEPDKPPFPL